MDEVVRKKAERFSALHQRDGILVMPNAWDRGSARILAAAGFEAIATTSAGTNYANGTTDGDYHVPRDDMLRDFGLIAREVPIPCNGDLENGYGHRPEDVAETVRLSIAAGMAGGNIEDGGTGRREAPLYDIGLAAERIRAARAAIDALAIPYVLTARTECYLIKHDDAFRESVKRLNAYRAAGADVLYAPGIDGKTEIAALARALDGPINVVMGRYARQTIGELAEAGVKRASVGGAFMLAAYGALKEAADELRTQGTLGWAEKLLSRADLQAALKVR